MCLGGSSKAGILTLSYDKTHVRNVFVGNFFYVFLLRSMSGNDVLYDQKGQYFPQMGEFLGLGVLKGNGDACSPTGTGLCFEATGLSKHSFVCHDMVNLINVQHVGFRSITHKTSNGTCRKAYGTDGGAFTKRINEYCVMGIKQITWSKSESPKVKSKCCGHYYSSYSIM